MPSLIITEGNDPLLLDIHLFNKAALEIEHSIPCVRDITYSKNHQV